MDRKSGLKQKIDNMKFYNKKYLLFAGHHQKVLLYEYKRLHYDLIFVSCNKLRKAVSNNKYYSIFYNTGVCISPIK